VDGLAGPRTQAALLPWYRGYVTHTVVRGDTLWRVAGRYDTTLSALETANPGLDPFDLRIGQRLTVPLPFAVVPTDIPWSSALAEYAAQGLTARYPALRRESLGRSVLGRELTALTLGEGARRVLFTAAHHANEWITAPLLMKYIEALLDAYYAGSPWALSPPGGVDRQPHHLVPTVNPDGVDLVTDALTAAERQGAEAIARRWPSIPFPRGGRPTLRAWI
jgi:g-D-glutamyl-meso-diaminopimelate peptidase